MIGLAGRLRMGGGRPIEVVGTSQSQNASTVNISGIGLSAGDMVFCWSFGDGFGVPNTPTGYTLIQSAGNSGASYMLAYRTITGSGDTTLISGLTAASDFGHIAVAVRGGNGLDVTPPAAFDNSGGGDPLPPPITTVTNGALILMFGAQDDDIDTLVSVPSGSTALTFPTNDYYQVGVTDNGGTMVAAYLIKDIAGLYTPTKFNLSSADANFAMTVAIRPA